MFPRENLDINRDREDNNFKCKIFTDESRIFGKDLMNTQNNQFVPPQVKIMEKISNKNNNQDVNSSFISKHNHTREESQHNKISLKTENKNSNINDDSESLSQIIAHNSFHELSDSKDYKNLSLVNENFIKKKELTNFKLDEKEMIKIGNYYVKKSAFVQLNKTKGNSQNESNSSTDLKFLKYQKDELELEECDRLVQNNPQFTSQYVKDIFLDLKENEHINCSKLDYLETIQNDINEKMRAVLIDWIIEVHQKFKLESETLYLTINLIDRYLSIQRIDRSKLQLVAVSAMLIASKYEEIYAPEVRDFVYITDKTYSKEEIIKTEYKILSTLKFDILCVSPLTFLRRYHFVTKDNLRSFYLAQFILEFSFLEYKLTFYPASIKAAACLFISRKLLKIQKAWDESLISVTQYEEKDFKPCVKELCKILELLPRINLKAAVNKFAGSKYMEVSKINMFN